MIGVLMANTDPRMVGTSPRNNAVSRNNATIVGEVEANNRRTVAGTVTLGTSDLSAPGRCAEVSGVKTANAVPLAMMTTSTTQTTKAAD